ncbi:Aerobic glycerol-3-phosphate dehydrogenase [Marinobacter nitratireducens]|uniref:Glycerol-3-phosphate dehydrogenase n=1 Tax=Marinobacter nitratireducens TaxID=1137280 RepID=A0A072N311_9GAMM|nr:glycerol-3-phosphate dehydrogenase [Marinobacter nitratireducens]KEF32069.1 Aerobic glycerol-3-phosphate dehydrogenase [Marinobacter nitratireducens]
MESESNLYDVLVVGGGVNGTGIALDAAGRGLKVLLCEMDDLASATSSSSSKLIHGGLRYLEHYEFRLVKEALAEREALLRNAPHIMWPMRFRLPHRPHLRPAWMIRTGLFLYDHLAKRETLAGSHSIRFGADSPLKPEISKGFEYSDGWVDDARLVVLTARKAQEKGAKILTRTKCIHAERGETQWNATLRDMVSGTEKSVSAKVIVNATGPWVSRLFDESLSMRAPKQIRMVKGSHIVVPRINQGDEAYILQNEDERIVFVIPYEDQFSLVGTTDVEYRGDPKKAQISEEETDYLIGIVNDYFRNQLTRNDVVWSYSGVRPLMDDEGESAQKASRDYSFEVNESEGMAPLISVFGGKITTFRKLAEAATNRLCDYFPEAGSTWTRRAILPGGEFGSQETLSEQLETRFPWLARRIIKRYVRTYGTDSFRILEGCHARDDLGTAFTDTLFQREVDYLIENEWARTSEDVLWRRTKQGLYITREKLSLLEHYLAETVPERR